MDVWRHSPILLACGVQSFLGRASLEEMIKTMKAGTPKLIRRGVQSAGIETLYLVDEKVPPGVQIPGFRPVNEEDPVRIHKWVSYKQWFDKRADQVKEFFKGHEKALRETLKHNPIRDHAGNLSIMHTRFATTGSNDDSVEDLTRAAHPHSWVQGHWAPIWSRGLGPLGVVQAAYRWVHHIFAFNGDLEELRRLLFSMPPGSKLNNEELRLWLSRWLYTEPGDVASGDAPTIAGLLDLFYTQGRWFESLRYGMAVHIAENEKTAPPPKERLTVWSHFFEHAFDAYVSGHPLSQELEEVPEEEILGFVDYLRNLLEHAEARDRFLRARMPRDEDRNLRDQFREAMGEIRRLGTEKYTTLLLKGSWAFFKNSLDYAVVHEIKPRYEGSIGGVFASTLNPPGSRVSEVYFALGQGMAQYYDERGENIVASSDRKVLPQRPGSRLTMDDGVGEVKVIGLVQGKIHITIYSGPNNRVLTDEEIQRRRKDMSDPKQVDQLPEADPLFEKQPLEAEIKRMIQVITEVHNDGRAVRERKASRNLQPSIKFTMLLMRKHIEELVRKQMRFNERNLPDELDEALWQRARVLTRQFWAEEKMDEAALLARTKKEAATIDSLLEDRYLSDDRKWLVPMKKPRLERAAYDLIMVGTEKSEYAGQAFGLTMQKMLGLRVKSISSNDFLEQADLHRDDLPGFYQAMDIDPKRTILFCVSESAETFDTDLAAQWAARTVREMFVMTGGWDNRLGDLVDQDRAFDFKNPISMEETHLAAYAGVNMAFTELALFVGKNITARFSKYGFFGLERHHKNFADLEAALDKLVNERAPEIVGYRASGEKVASKDSQLLKSEGRFLASFITEAPRAWLLRLAYIVVTVGYLHKGAAAAFVGWFLERFFKAPPSQFWFWSTTVVDVAIYASLVLSSIVGLRRLLPVLGLPAPPLLTRIGAKKIVISDSHAMVWRFMKVFGRKGEALAYGINSFFFDAVHTNAASDEWGVALDRGSILGIGRPDSRVPRLQPAESAALTGGRHARGVLTMPFRRLLSWMPSSWLKFQRLIPVSAYVFTFGSNNPPPDDSELRARHKHMAVSTALDLGPHAPDWVQDFYGDRIDAFKRLLAIKRLLVTMIQETADHPPTYQPGRTHPNTGTQTTAKFWGGSHLIRAMADLPMMLESIENPDVHRTRGPNPFHVDVRPLPSWRLLDETARQTDVMEQPPVVEPAAAPEPAQAAVEKSRDWTEITIRMAVSFWLVGVLVIASLFFYAKFQDSFRHIPHQIWLYFQWIRLALRHPGQ